MKKKKKKKEGSAVEDRREKAQELGEQGGGPGLALIRLSHSSSVPNE